MPRDFPPIRSKKSNKNNQQYKQRISMKTIITALTCVLLPATLLNAASSLTLQDGFGGRWQNDSNGTDYVPGNTTTPSAWRTDRANLGNSSGNDEWVLVWSFLADSLFAAEIAGGEDAVIQFDSGQDPAGVAAAGGPTTPTTVYFLAYNSDAGVGIDQAQAQAALELPSPATLGSFTYSGLNVDYSYTVPNALLAGVADGQRIYFALDSLLDNDGIEQYFKPGSIVGDNNALARITLTTPVPEPSAAALTLLGLAGALGLRRWRGWTSNCL
jgi:hypothetical protein